MLAAFDDDAAGYGALRAYRGEVVAYVGDGLQVGAHRMENWAEALTAVHPALATALLHSTHRV